MRIVPVLSILLVFAACQAPSPPEMTDAERAQIQAEVERTAQDWIESWNSQDCEYKASFWHPEYQTQSAGGEFIKTFDDRMQNCRRIQETREGFSGGWTSTDVRVISPNAAVFTGNFEGTFRYRDGTPPRHYAHSAGIILFERTDTGWGITFTSSSNDPPQPVSDEG